jgi:DNA invertase Pin-like site-specific DNA recombinase
VSVSPASRRGFTALMAGQLRSTPHGDSHSTLANIYSELTVKLLGCFAQFETAIRKECQLEGEAGRRLQGREALGGHRCRAFAEGGGRWAGSYRQASGRRARIGLQCVGRGLDRATASVAAPANANTKPRKIAASIVERVQGPRMWITGSASV